MESNYFVIELILQLFYSFCSQIKQEDDDESDEEMLFEVEPGLLLDDDDEEEVHQEEPIELLQIKPPKFSADYRVGNFTATESMIPNGLPNNIIQLIVERLDFLQADETEPQDLEPVHSAFQTGLLPGNLAFNHFTQK